MAHFTSFAQFTAWLNHKGLFHMDLGLERMRKAAIAPQWPVIQVLGTNGKGSTSAYLANLARIHGLKTGLYTSPHFLSIKERILVNGETPDERIWLRRAARLSGCDSTWFEFMTLLAVALFNECEIDLGVFEAGLGGKNDATSALPAMSHCFTPIAMDHAAILGPGIADIARDKIGAIQPSAAVFSAHQYPPVESALYEKCRALGLTPVLAPSLASDYVPGLAGAHQKENAALALAAWRAFAKQRGIVSKPALERQALAETFVPGRQQRIPASNRYPELLLDGAHNPHAIRNLLAQPGKRPAAVIFSALADKDWRPGLAMLAKTGGKIRIIELANARAEKATRMAGFANALRPNSAEVSSGMEEALDACAEGPVWICGSLYLLGEFYAIFPEYLARTR